MHRCRYRCIVLLFGLAQALQHDQAALIAELSATGAPDIVAGTAASGSERSYAVVPIPLVQNIHQVKLIQINLRYSRVPSIMMKLSGPLVFSRGELVPKFANQTSDAHADLKSSL